MHQNTIENLENKLNILKIAHSKKVLSIQNTLEGVKGGAKLDTIKSKKGLPFAVLITETALTSENVIFAKLQQHHEHMHYPTSKEALFKDLKSLSNAFGAIGEILDETNLPNVYEFVIKKSILYGSILMPLHFEIMLKVIYLNDEKNKRKIILDIFLEN